MASVSDNNFLSSDQDGEWILDGEWIIDLLLNHQRFY